MDNINIDDISKKFEDHLKIEENYRIIFSGKFGIGKTYFVNNFFDERKEIYNKFIISPVNYVVSSNEDIFELIKADIINNLFFTGKIEFSQSQKKKLFEKIFLFANDKPLALVKFVSSLLSKFNPLFEITDTFLKSAKELKDSFTEYTKTLNAKEQTRHEELIEFLENFEQKEGSIYEHNYITKVINTFLEELQKEKKNVLIIDDLDRIDPEHIFRILNILSAHNNHYGSKNKFAFDNIIIVCDIENIQKIFYHKYGINVDFDGYIDKFYSTYILQFTNTDAVVNYVNAIYKDEDLKRPYLDLVTLILKVFVEQDLLSIRKLIKHKYDTCFEKFNLHEQVGINEKSRYQDFGNNFYQDSCKFYVDSNDFPLLNFFKLMTFIWGDFDIFLEQLAKVKQTKATLDYKTCSNIISFLALQHHIATKKGDDIFIQKFRENHSGSRSIVSVGWPKNDFLGQEFDLHPGWTRGNLYQSQNSYFSQSYPNDKSLTYNSSSLEIKLSDIFESLKIIAEACSEKNFLSKIGIISRKAKF